MLTPCGCARRVASGNGAGKGGKNEKEGEEQDFCHKLYPTEGGASFSIFAPIPSLQFSVEAIPRAEPEHKKGEKQEAHPSLGHPSGLLPPQRAAS